MILGLPNNETLREFAREAHWQQVDETRDKFREYLSSIRDKRGSHPVSAAKIKHLSQSYYDDYDEIPEGNLLLSKGAHRPVVLAALLGKRFRQGPWLDYLKPYNLNPSVYHENIHEAGGPLRVRPVGVELEVGMARLDGAEPTEANLDLFHQAYIEHAMRLGGNLDLSPELCIYQAELVLPPTLGFGKALHTLEQNIGALVHAIKEAELCLAITSTYPFESDFATSQTDKVETVAIFLNDINESRPRQCGYLEDLARRYQVTRGQVRTANLLRFQGYHMHVDLAGRSEALGMLSYAMNLGSASAIAAAALLKGGPFMDGTCDPELLCTREYVRNISITGHYVGLPLSPHLQPEGLERHGHLLRANLANGTARALLYGLEDDLPYSGMHNMLGRVRPDLGGTKGVCTLESTGMPSNPSAERLAAIATDFQYNQLAIEHYFRQHGTDLDALYDDKDMLEIFGPLDRETFMQMLHQSDLLCTDLQITTATGTTYTLVEFYEKKRRMLKRLLSPLNVIDTRDVDGLYDRIYHFLVSPNGAAQTIDDYINHPTRRGTGNWGNILRNAYVEAGGTVGAKNPMIVHSVMMQLNEALQRRYIG
ncbi:MAG: hypothetical protein KF726_24675 [Anaerolineae bacterium]|nr:hypothetical protein [Anaerolineae bacterium]